MKERKIKEIDMTQGPIMKQIIMFGLPILLGSIFQQMYNIVDSVVVGNYVGTDALAAVGSASTVAFCLVNLSAGLTSGASVVIAQLLGAKKRDDIRHALSTTFFFALIVSVVLTAVGIFGAEPLMRLINVPEDLLPDAAAYMKIYCGGTIFLMLYNFFSSMLRALGDSRTPLIFLIISTILNVGGDLFFVLSLDMGVAGVAIATVLAQVVSVVLCAVYCSKKIEHFQFKKGEFRFYKELFGDIVRMSVPSALQFAAGSFGFILVQGLINSFGTSCMAAYTATSKLENLSHLPLECFSQALAVFVGQNMGAGNIKRIRQGLRRVLVTLLSICVVIGIVVYMFGPNLVSLFTGPEAIEVMTIGGRFLRIWAPFTLVFAAEQSFCSTLRGSGDSVFVMLASLADLGMRTVAAYAFASWFDLGLGFYGVAYGMLCGWGASLLLTLIRYLTGRWKYKGISAANAIEDN